MNDLAKLRKDIRETEEKLFKKNKEYLKELIERCNINVAIFEGEEYPKEDFESCGFLDDVYAVFILDKFEEFSIKIHAFDGDVIFKIKQ